MLKRTVVILLSAFSLISCKKIDEDVSSSKQVERIETYLATKTEPFTIDSDVYRVKTNVVDNSSNIALAVGDSLYIFYAQYIFNTAPGLLFNTNIKAVAEGDGIDSEAMVYEPLGLKYGESNIIAGLEIGLRNGIKGDSLMLYITSENAFKDKANGVVPKNSSIAMFVSIDKIVKNK